MPRTWTVPSDPKPSNYSSATAHPQHKEKKRTETKLKQKTNMLPGSYQTHSNTKKKKHLKNLKIAHQHHLSLPLIRRRHLDVSDLAQLVLHLAAVAPRIAHAPAGHGAVGHDGREGPVGALNLLNTFQSLD